MGRSLARDHGAKRAALLKAAARAFAASGVAGASMAEVARAAGVSKGVLYHYWPSKEALLFEILDGYLSDLRDVVLAEGELGPLLEAILLAYEGMDAEHRIQGEGMALLPPEKAEVLRGYQREMVARMGEVLGDRRRSAVMSVFGMLNWFYMWHPGADRAARLAYARDVAAIARGGVGALGG
ncbi:TetR/AcrR family transcriptional regulator [Jannaschia marina]|uniref:TetR/AcrR family transcriptional regulator n=1 Tax=Jannaschia marina TaxID=2741674 RepID=UPI0015CC7D38|nr:TetR/AcrR family transcriptional regulator [Jannaschia marina]